VIPSAADKPVVNFDKTGHSAGLFIAAFLFERSCHSSDLLRDSKIGRSVGGNKSVTLVWFQ
jgi:hypothetical protein